MAAGPAFVIEERTDLNCILVRWAGRFRVSGMVGYLDALGRCRLLDRGASVFNDLRLLDMDAGTAEMAAFARLPVVATRHPGVHSVALLVGSDLAHGMVRVMISLRESRSWRFNLFRSLDEAGAWLGLPADLGDPFRDMPLPDDGHRKDHG